MSGKKYAELLHSNCGIRSRHARNWIREDSPSFSSYTSREGWRLVERESHKFRSSTTTTLESRSGASPEALPFTFLVEMTALRRPFGGSQVLKPQHGLWPGRRNAAPGPRKRVCQGWASLFLLPLPSPPILVTASLLLGVLKVEDCMYKQQERHSSGTARHHPFSWIIEDQTCGWRFHFVRGEDSLYSKPDPVPHSEVPLVCVLGGMMLVAVLLM